MLDELIRIELKYELITQYYSHTDSLVYCRPLWGGSSAPSTHLVRFKDSGTHKQSIALKALPYNKGQQLLRVAAGHPTKHNYIGT